MKHFARSLVVGKFSPLHRGHEHLLTTALSESDEVVVFAYNKPEFDGCEPEKKVRWFERLFPSIRAFVIHDGNVGDLLGSASLFQSVPSEDEPEDIHRRFCAELYATIVGEPLEAIFTSESYGPGFVEAVNRFFAANTDLPPTVMHREVDRARVTVPVSATQVRAQIHEHAGFLSPLVYRDFIHTVCFYGGESTGKTTIAQLLAEYFRTTWTPEYGRELWVERDGDLSYDDMTTIAERHVLMEEQAALEAHRYLFVDTSPLTTLFYCLAKFQKATDTLKTLAERRYGHVFLCMPDIPFVQDSTRVDEEFRRRQHDWYLAELGKRQIPFTQLAGSLAERTNTVVRTLSELFPE
ncbi:MAG: AAA family ATPase [Bdellovibrionota bacterium]